MDLPIKFKERMADLLKEDYDALIDSYQKSHRAALRINRLKTEAEPILNALTCQFERVPWTQEGYYYSQCRPGKSPLHDAGAYYIQEASAMYVAEVVDAQPGEYILDLCAAPGGKSTAIAADMQGQGMLVANEIHPKRARILSHNIERMGIPHAIVTNESPDRLANHFPAFFDKIVVDAPCSGEGMFNTEPQAMDQWSEDNIWHCHLRQRDIMEQAVKMLKPGGKLIYSTCTFAPEENELTIQEFLNANPDMQIEAISDDDQFDRGHPEWIADGQSSLQEARRLWPYQIEGEGHFVCSMVKDGSSAPGRINDKVKPIDRSKQALWDQFNNDYLTIKLNGTFVLMGEELYLLPVPLNLDGIKLLRPGLHLGTFKKNRFEPSHSLALALTPQQAQAADDYRVDAPAIDQYLKGQVIPTNHSTGWVLVSVEGLSLGWGKAVRGQLKNHYPKGLRHL